MLKNKAFFRESLRKRSKNGTFKGPCDNLFGGRPKWGDNLMILKGEKRVLSQRHEPLRLLRLE